MSITAVLKRDLGTNPITRPKRKYIQKKKPNPGGRTPLPLKL